MSAVEPVRPLERCLEREDEGGLKDERGGRLGPFLALWVTRSRPLEVWSDAAFLELFIHDALDVVFVAFAVSVNRECRRGEDEEPFIHRRHTVPIIKLASTLCISMGRRACGLSSLSLSGRFASRMT